MMIDIAVLGYLLLGAVLGYVNAILKALIKSVSLILPLIVMSYFLDEAVLLGREVLALALSTSAEDLGIWGVFAAFVGAGGSVVLLRLLLGLFTLALSKDTPKMPARFGGAAIGITTNVLLLLLAVQFWLFFLPSPTRDTLTPTLIGKVILPVSERLEPSFKDFMAVRTQRVMGSMPGATADGPDVEQALKQLRDLPEEDRQALFEQLQNIDFEQLKAVLETQMPAATP